MDPRKATFPGSPCFRSGLSFWAFVLAGDRSGRFTPPSLTLPSQPADILRTMLQSPVAAVLFANALWLVVCSIWAILCFGQAGKDRASRTGFQKPIGPNDID